MDIEFNKSKKLLYKLCDLNTGDVFKPVDTHKIFMIIQDNHVINLTDNTLDRFSDDTEVVLLKAKLILEY